MPPRNIPYSEIRICENCGNEFELPYSIKKAGRFCSRACLYAWMSKDAYTTTICAYCQEPFTHRSNQRNRQYCSSSCAMRIHASGVRNNAYKPRITAQCEFCGRLKDIQPCKLKRFRFCSADCTRAWVLQNMPTISSIEIKMKEAFERAAMHPQTQYIVGSFCLDFAFADVMLAVECDGDYWHNTEYQKKKDKQRDGFLRSQGWHIIRLSETDINMSPADCVKRVQSRLQSLTS